MAYFLETKKRIFILFLAVSIGLLFSLVQLAKAQTGDQSVGFQVSPTRLDWDMNTSEERTGTINLKNYSNSEKQIDISVEDFYVTDDSTQAQFFVPDASHPLFAYDVINWIEIPQSIILAPNEGRDITFRLKIPEQTPTGGYYGAVFFKTKAPDKQSAESGASQIGVNYRIGVLLTMAVKGSQPIIKKGEITIFKAVKKIFWDNPAEFLAQISNTGNLHYKISGTIDIYKFGKKIFEINLDPRLAYPGKIRIYDEQWKFTPWSYGFYRAKINLTSEDHSINLTDETTFWVIPWKTTLAVILIILAIYMIYKWFGTKFEIRKKNQDDAE